jgi:hypothetical protein
MISCTCQLQDTSCGENAVHMSWQDRGGQSSSTGHATDPYPGLLQRPEHDSSMQMGYVFLHAIQNELSLCPTHQSV